MAIHSNRSKVIGAIMAREDFQNGKSLTGRTTETPRLIMAGQLRDSKGFYAAMDAAQDAGKSAYVVKSYDTPIGWYVDGEGWTVADEKFSNTTTNHQHLLRMAVN